MASRDLHNLVKVVPAINPATINTDGVNTGAIIDTSGFDSVEFLLQSAAVTDGTFTPKVEHGDDSGLSDAATVAAGQLLGTVANATFISTDDNATKKLGYVGGKRYVRLSLPSVGIPASATATIVSAVATNAVTIAGHAFTAVANGGSPTGDQWAVGAGGTADADSATALAAAINNSVTSGIAGVVTASALAGVVTIAAVGTGAVGNSITLTKTGSPITVTGGGTLASGNDATGVIGALCVLGDAHLGPVA